MSDAPPLRVVPLVPSERPLVFSSWLRSLHADVERRHGDPATTIPRRAFFDGEHERVERLLDTATTHAVKFDGIDEVIGWACATPPAVLHFVFVKDAYRRTGVARTVLAGFGMLPGRWAFSTYARPVALWASRYDLVYNPYLG